MQGGPYAVSLLSQAPLPSYHWVNPSQRSGDLVTGASHRRPGNFVPMSILAAHPFSEHSRQVVKKKSDNLGDDAVPYYYFLSRLICPKEETLVTCRFRNGHLEEETKFFATAALDPLFWSRASGDSWNVYIHTAFRSQVT